MVENTQFDENLYRTNLGNYLSTTNALQDWQNARDDANLRTLIGNEIYNDPESFLGHAATSEQVRAGVERVNQGSTRKVAEQTRANLETILDKVVSTVDPGSILGGILALPSYDVKGTYSDTAKAHKEARDAINAYRTDNINVMIAYTMEAVEDEYKSLVPLHAANNPHFKNIFARGIMKKKQEAFENEFIKSGKDEQSEPELDKDKARGYLKVLAEKTEDNAELTRGFASLAYRAYTPRQTQTEE